MRVLFRCDGGDRPEVGTGHVVRCLLLADRLRAVGAEAAIALRDFGGRLLGDIEGAGHLALSVPDGVPEPEATLKVVALFRPDLMVVDRLANEPDHLRAYQREGIVLAVLDDLVGSQGVVDLAINAILTGAGSPYEGEDYLVLPELESHVGPPRSSIPTVFLSFGGYDHGDLVAKGVRALAGLEEPVFLLVGVGGDYPNLAALRDALRAQPHPHELLVGLSPREFSARLRDASVAVVAGGLTMYDAFRHGVPAVVVSQYPHQAVKAKEFAAAGIAVHLGSTGEVSEERIRSAVEDLLRDEQRRAMLGWRGRARVDGQGLRRVSALLQVVERLAWDSGFFGFCVGRLWPTRLTPGLLDLAERRCRELGIRCLYYLCDSTHPDSAVLAQARGFRLVDTRVTLGCSVPAPSPQRPKAEITIRPARASDLPALTEIAGDAFGQSRFYVDPNFSREAASRLYRVWVEKSCAGFADAVLVAEPGGQAAGFVTCHLPREGLGTIGLLGVDRSQAGRGLGRALVTAALDWFGARRVQRVEVATQGRNQSALRLYEGCALTVVRVECWHHRWFETGS